MPGYHDVSRLNFGSLFAADQHPRCPLICCVKASRIFQIDSEAGASGEYLNHKIQHGAAARNMLLPSRLHNMKVDGPLNSSLPKVLMVQQTSHECRRCRCCTVLIATPVNVCLSFSAGKAFRARFVSTRVRRPYVLHARSTLESLLAERLQLGQWNIWAMLLPRAERKKKCLKATFSVPCTSFWCSRDAPQCSPAGR